MRKFILFLALAFSLLTASELSEFQRAQALEQSGDIKGAMQIYKSIAANSINAQSMASRASLNAEPATPEAKIKQAKITQENKADHHLQNALGIELYKFNYLLPVTYAKTVPDDGRKSVETKFQISLAKPLFYDVFGLRESLVAAYTQTSWWQITKTSAPFRETNYQPEIFLNFASPKYLEQIGVKNLKFGLLHESNGRDGTNSRSWNRAYVQGDLVYGDLTISPRVWSVIGEKNDNKEILNYIGHGDLRLSYKLNDQIFSLMLRNNLHFDKTNKGAAELSYMFPIFSSGVYSYLQYFTGYGESLIDYDRHTDKVGLGFVILK
ncbi:phospholipase A [Campylobacter concisus]|uniref:Phosphatidylcholine 1-acylhydrolase n=1 Tax=Campylobacter concisus TaxID=199 RepID=A0A1Y5MJA3_9BACT|nr:phospholipase A [Campylobacter concisus]OUT07233.1 phospholipase [Campylobacter concisus]